MVLFQLMFLSPSFMRYTTPLILSVLVVLSACNGTTETQTPDDQVSVTTSSAAIEPSDTSSSATASAAVEVMETDIPATARVIDMDVTNWDFTPNTINAAVEEEVYVRMKGVSGEHSLALKDFGINVTLSPGETKIVRLPTDTAGSFQFRCRIPCGPGHNDMVGTLVVG